MSSDLVKLLLTGTQETLYMVVLSSIIAFLLGVPIGVLLVVSDKGGIFPLLKVNKIVGFIINVIRSMPEMILIIILLPLAKINSRDNLRSKCSYNFYFHRVSTIYCKNNRK